MVSVANSFSGKPRKASMAAYRQLLAENHVEEILQDVKQNKKLKMRCPQDSSSSTSTRRG